MICSRDKQGQDGFYEPIAVIEYLGKLSSTGLSRGHYTCDVRQFPTEEWYRTNDSTVPSKICQDEVSKYGYVVLFRRTGNCRYNL